MKKCPSCGRSYSDMVTVCPGCNVALSDESSSVVSSSGSSVPLRENVPQPPVQVSGNSTGSNKISLVLWGAVAVVAVILLLLGASVATIVGAAGVSALVGLIPKKVAESRGKDSLAQIAWPVTALAGEFLGLIASIPAAIIFVILAFVI